MFHYSAQLAHDRKLPYQIHTGLLAGNSANLDNTRPMLFNNVIQRYPRVQFDLFHLGWPWTHEVTALAKVFPNVTVDFCWAWVISPTGARNALHELLETVPVNKLIGFGGDYRHVELTYAHSRMARAGIAQVLAERVAEGFCSETRALDLARLLLHDNAARLFPNAKQPRP
jgi:predicted TIM-barrel fold metal-dependent hydrolase